ncbi:hypothetical protein cypCar_00038547 [Cyprinus carpio]|nr:hypothetical protein cypCar_00038547 [Cyprinus carpio]
MKGENNTLEIQLDETSRLLKIAQNKEKQLIEERDGLLETVKGLQQTLHQQCDLRVENERLKNAALQMKKENEAQLKFGAKLARAQSMSTKSQPQTQASAPHPQNIFKRKLQFIQEEKNKEIEVLRQRVRDLEQQSLHGLMDSRLKRRKI